MGDLSKFLAGAAKSWEDTVEEAKKSGFEDPPDGQYIMRIASAELTESRAGNVMIKWQFPILEGDCAGQVKTEFMRLDGTRGLEPLAWRLQSLGIKLEDVNMEQLPEFLKELVADCPALRVTLTSRGDFQNVRITRLLPNYEIPDEDDDAEVELQAGMKVSFKAGRKTLIGEVVEVDNDEGSATVDVDGEAHEVSFDAMTVIDEGKDE